MRDGVCCYTGIGCAASVSIDPESLAKMSPDNNRYRWKFLVMVNELADTIIRIMDLAGALQLDVAGAIIEKLAYNQQRPDHKKEAREAEGGKSL